MGNVYRYVFLEIIPTERLTSVEYEEINFTDFNFLNFV